MRKLHQKQILEILQTIKEAQDKRQYGDCQEGSLALCDFIDSIAGTDTQTVTMLLQYCEALFKVNNGELAEKHLRKFIVKIENSVKLELKPSRIEIVFLSYKASMSDSLESVYFAARANPSCDAYWIPIPYYEIVGNTQHLRYEGADCYSDRFEVTDWQAYDIETRRPDAIFTFAPYDAGNHVTRVHPNFYCERLKDFTDMLVYVPYFISPPVLGAANSLTSGILHSNLSVMQSEHARQQYIYYFSKAIEGNEKAIEIFSSKVIALGSPKVDKLLNEKPEDYPIPKEWQKKILNIKERKGHIVFYNTTIYALLSYTNEKHSDYLTKMEKVFEYFKRLESVLLLWRPHPLLEQTFKSMRPNIYAKFNELRESFISTGRGIYDDSPDVHRAVQLSDAMYGDHSSIWVMFKILGKPTLLQGFDINFKSGLKWESSYAAHNYLYEKVKAKPGYPHFYYGYVETNLPLFIENLPAQLANNEVRKTEYLTNYLDSADGTAGEKILNYVISQL